MQKELVKDILKSNGQKIDDSMESNSGNVFKDKKENIFERLGVEK